MDRKGFTLVELLATILILGILMGISITAVSKYINKAKTETEEDIVNTVKQATVSYLQDNKSFLPKEDGASVDIYVNDLYDAKYITNKLVNGNKEECMESSYAHVTKVKGNKYLYDVYLYCAGRLITDEVTSNTPIIGNFRFNNLDDINNMNFTFSLSINNSNDYIDEYSYVIYYKANSESEYEEVYNSGSISGNHNPKINETINIKDKIPFVSNNNIKVTITVKSNTGISNSETITSN